MPPRHHPIPPHALHDGPPPPPHQAWAQFNAMLLNERDEQLLYDLLGNQDEARAVYRLLESGPPEMAAVGTLVLRLFEKIRDGRGFTRR